MAYLSAFVSYLKQEKTRHDIMDYGRALLIMLSMAAVLKAALDMI